MGVWLGILACQTWPNQPTLNAEPQALNPKQGLGFRHSGLLGLGVLEFRV